jgi:hypothetical protein
MSIGKVIKSPILGAGGEARFICFHPDRLFCQARPAANDADRERPGFVGCTSMVFSW